MLISILQNDIVNDTFEFKKLTKDIDPYYFYEWKGDKNNLVLRYFFYNQGKTKVYRKRVFISELESLLETSVVDGIIFKRNFNSICLRTKKDGDCGFAVMVAIIGYLFGIQKICQGKYKIINKDKLHVYFVDLRGVHKLDL